MYSKALILTSILILILALAAFAQDTENPNLEIFGFGDLLATFKDNNDGNTFSVGQVELDLESQLTDKFAMALAIAYDGEVFGIGAVTAEYTLWSVDGSSSEMMGLDFITLGGGQFDVPFGIDYHVYPSIDRKLASAPLVVENTHGLWNDYGVYLSAEANWGNFTAFAVNGFVYEGEDPQGNTFTTQNDIAFGGRLGIAPRENIEIGASASLIQGVEGSDDMLLYGADIQVDAENLEIRGEYIAHKFDRQSGDDFTNDGYYIQALYNLSDWYLVSRYDEFRPNQESSEIDAISIGIGHIITEAIEIRLEYRISDEEDNAAIFQFAFGF